MSEKRFQTLFWSAYSQVYDGLLNFKPYVALIAQATSELRLSDGAVVADLGCGTGNCLRLVAEQTSPRAGTLIGVDSSPQMIRIAGKKLSADERVQLVNQSLLDWLEEQDNDTLDNVVSVNVLYTMQPHERKRFWDGISRTLKTNGNAVIVTTDRAGMGPVLREHFAQVPLWRAFPPSLVILLLMNMIIWLLESRQVFDPADLSTLCGEASEAGLSVTHTERCYGGHENGVDVLLVVEKPEP